MCGVTGIFAFNLVGKFNKIHVTAATMALASRGPDYQDIYLDERVALGHRRLSIIDTSEAGHQPMWDASGRYGIVFNGEIFNFRELREELKSGGLTFRSHSDTEVLLNLYIRDKERCLDRLNGFFSFCIYDKHEQALFLARDRYGIKPLLYTFDEDKFIFASEMKAMACYGLEKEIDFTSLYTYLQLNYIPAPFTIFSNVRKLLPGHYLKVTSQHLETHRYYELPTDVSPADTMDYESAKEKLRQLLDDAVQRRLVSDVPLGAFLSGGIDSSIVTALASRHKSDLHTFSIGFRDEKYFDETHYAKMVADHCGTDHTIFSLTNDDLYQHLHGILDYLDEPFADSSAIAVYILSRETRKHATVALSGDGADELFAGYNKHEALWRSMHPGFREKVVTALGPLWRALPQSRNSPASNKVRQLARFVAGVKHNLPERYWLWAGFADESAAMHLLNAASREKISQYGHRKNGLLSPLTDSSRFNDVLRADLGLVLSNDMLPKVDLMSMAHGLEVRLPFLDYELVNFVTVLPEDFKIKAPMRKRILKDAFGDMLPRELYGRPKKGFEVPLLKWFRKELRSTITDDLLEDEFIRGQGIFNPDSIAGLKKKLFSSNPGDAHARVWAIIVFQSWWKKYT